MVAGLSFSVQVTQYCKQEHTDERCQHTKTTAFPKSKGGISYEKKCHYFNQFLAKNGTAPIERKTRLFDLILRPQIKLSDIIQYLEEISSGNRSRNGYGRDIMHAVETDIKYQGYKERDKIIAEKIKRLEEVKIKRNFNFRDLKSISTEARQKLNRIQPETIGQASRIPGVSPADINILLTFLGR